MNAPDKVIVTADQNPAFFEELRKMQLGEKGCVELHFTKDEQSQESAVLGVQAYVPDGYEIADEAEAGGDMPSKPATLPGNTVGDANMTPTAMMVRKKAAKG